MSFVWRIVTTGMTTTFAEPHRVHHRALARSAVARRMLPLQVASLCQGMMLWVPVEKLFMSKIGFTPASIGLMGRRLRHRCSGPGSPVGLLADRWSRKGVLVAATVALVLAVAIGAAANTVGMCAFGTLVEPHRRELRALLPHARLLQRRRRTHPRHLPQSMAGPPTSKHGGPANNSKDTPPCAPGSIASPPTPASTRSVADPNDTSDQPPTGSRPATWPGSNHSPTHS